MLVVTELHRHRNGIGGTGYYAGRAQWTPEDGRRCAGVRRGSGIAAPEPLSWRAAEGP